ncbi:PREDICTED: uncharacterized protein LOC108569504 [Nicrophorus vespilloides]|uniref:Uncharacterized protein LOC108569504 n=1 Tax=Nicrophorus vespilloides TaxID=110193 RepID=A0ABM1NIB4_NICVS|nr:PREDICTED: uncharacterized protein LOC108569504 [Nicrophorus vespilloides]
MSEKSFRCTKKGCQMSFTNEDNFTIHQRQHTVFLNLGLITQNETSDQTPTPTRFIRNCEEVGLFQDLQNVNPFEETFKKAVELSKNGIQHKPAEKSEDTTLHTPHILPHIPKAPSPSSVSDMSDDTEFTMPDNVLKIKISEYEPSEQKQTCDIVLPAKTTQKNNTLKIKSNHNKMRTESKINIYDTNIPQNVRRREMNRMAQVRSRLRKKQLNEVFENEVRELKNKNANLELENANLKIEVGILRRQLTQQTSQHLKGKKESSKMVNIVPAIKLIPISSVVVATNVNLQQVNGIKIETAED